MEKLSLLTSLLLQLVSSVNVQLNIQRYLHSLDKIYTCDTVYNVNGDIEIYGITWMILKGLGIHKM